MSITFHTGKQLLLLLLPLDYFIRYFCLCHFLLFNHFCWKQQFLFILFCYNSIFGSLSFLCGWRKRCTSSLDHEGLFPCRIPQKHKCNFSYSFCLHFTNRDMVHCHPTGFLHCYCKQNITSSIYWMLVSGYLFAHISLEALNYYCGFFSTLPVWISFHCFQLIFLKSQGLFV